MATESALKVGGQALADGVFMRTERAWAVARADGRVEVGATPPKRCPSVPVVRVLLGLATSLWLGLQKGLLAGRRRNRMFLLSLLTCEVVAVVLSQACEDIAASGVWRLALEAVPWMGVLVAFRLVSPAAVWRYHGAEHKAVTAYEQGVDLDDVAGVLACSRIHNRCGTNLVFLVGLAAIAFQHQRGLVQLPLVLLSLAVAAELTAMAARRPRALWSMTLLAGGRFLQRNITTAEPTAEEQRVGCRALQAALAEHARLEARDLLSEPALL